MSQSSSRPSCRAVSARLWHDALSFERNAQRPTVRSRCGHHHLHGCPQHQQGNHCRFRLGARTADIIVALWPERCKAIVGVSGYLITNLKANLQPLPPAAELGWWYQYYFATERGRLGYDKNRYEFNKLIWKLASPKWEFDDATFNRTAASFNNPDHVSIVIHNYRWRLSLAKGERRYDDLEQKLSHAPVITVPLSPLRATSMARPRTDDRTR